MNRLAGTDLLADAMPFATLDPTTRKVDLPEGYALFLTDTVGFIRNLPTGLVAAFRSTLEEVVYADFLILLIDASHPAWELQHGSVLDTLEALGAQDKPTILAFNKVDLLDEAGRAELERSMELWPNSVAISAVTGAGMDDLQREILLQVQSLLGRLEALVPYSESQLIQECYDFGRVLKVDYREDGIFVEAELVNEMRRKFEPYILT
jgi:GTP-binding protein HflX